MLETLLRLPLPDQIKALIEKVESLDETSSSYRISNWVKSSSTLTRYECWMLNRALNKRHRARTLCEAMSLVITPEPSTDEYFNDLLFGGVREVKRQIVQVTKRQTA